LRELGVEVMGTTRGAQRARVLQRAAVESLVSDLGEHEASWRAECSRADVVFYFVPPQSSGDDPLERVLAAAESAEAFVYAGSTAVYGDRGGDWVDEATPARPAGALAEARYQAERSLFDAAETSGMPTRICRIAGIYGPGRTLKQALESGAYVLVRGSDTWVNRIHVDDLASGLIAAWQRGGDGEVYNIVDDQPHRASEFAVLAAELHGLPRPAWVDDTELVARFGEARARRKLDSKRVMNRRLKEELSVQLAYPTYRSGLPAAVAEERGEAAEF
jgi:nucleoside-diphosphate-sugar epimerase